MMETSAAYFDGQRAVRRRASLTLDAVALIVTVENNPPVSWPFESLRLEDDQTNLWRFHKEEKGLRSGEQLDISDGDFAAALKNRCPALGGSQLERRTLRRKIITGSFAAVAFIAALVVYGLPAIAGWLAPVVPWRTEVALGRSIETEFLRTMAGPDARICEGRGTPAARLALEAMVTRLTAQASLPGPVTVKVIDSAQSNAFTLPGGHIYLMRGLIEAARHPDEVAGVLAHELGHMANRDSMRAVIHAGGMAFLVGTLLGDFTGAGALVITTKYLLGNRYSRSNEVDADAFAVDLMTRSGGDVRALGGFLMRIANEPGERRREILLSHPVTEDRVAAIDRAAPPGPRKPLLSDAEWRALRVICR
jgi:predicted Zn-dependent protease